MSFRIYLFFARIAWQSLLTGRSFTGTRVSFAFYPNYTDLVQFLLPWTFLCHNINHVALVWTWKVILFDFFYEFQWYFANQWSWQHIKVNSISILILYQVTLKKQQVYYFIVSTTSQHQFLQYTVDLWSESWIFVSWFRNPHNLSSILITTIHLVLQTFLNRSNISWLSKTLNSQFLSFCEPFTSSSLSCPQTNDSKNIGK